MPDKNILLILDRAFVDEQFRAQLLADLDGTVAGMGLTLSAEARTELKKALDEGPDFATGLDQRVSQSGFSLNPASLIRQKGSSKGQINDISVQSHYIRPKAVKNNGKKQSAANYITVDDEIMQSETIDYEDIDIEVER